MPFESILFLVLVIGAFTLFAAVLAYGDWATRQVTRESAALPASSVNIAETAPTHRVKRTPSVKAAA